MLHSIDLSRAAMLRHAQFVDATAHNIANNRSPGFKAIRAALESGDTTATAGTDLATDSGVPALTGRISVEHLFTQGSLTETGVSTDLAIQGEGFFSLRRPDGTLAYTRNGAFRPDAKGWLADASGNLLDPPITVPAGASSLRVAANGDATALLPSGASVRVGQVRLTRFINPNGLQSGADGLFSATAAAGAPQQSAPGRNGAGSVRTGALEDSNTDITEQMTNLASGQKAYQLNTAAFKMADDMLRLASQLERGG